MGLTLEQVGTGGYQRVSQLCGRPLGDRQLRLVFGLGVQGLGAVPRRRRVLVLGMLRHITAETEEKYS